MPNTYTQLYTHLIFVVKGRQNLISPSWKIELYKYITGTINGKKQKLIRINGVTNHLHILISLKADCTISAIARDIKANSSRWINERRLVKGKFEWQESYAAFSVGHSQVQIVSDYIDNQEKHHRKRTFMEEYVKFLAENEISFDSKYLPEDPGR